MNTNKKIARMAGAVYLTYILVTILGSAFGASPLIKFGDAAATANNILAHEAQFRMGFMIDLIAGVLFLLTAWALYALLKPVNNNFALLFLLLNLGGVAIQCLSDLFLFAPLLLLNGSSYLKVFQADQLQALVMFFLNLHKNGFMIAQIFYSAWLFPLGYLVYKSGFLPKFLGVLVLADFVCWLAYFFQYFLFPNFTVITYPCWAVGILAEFGLTLWLLIMGAMDQKPA